MSIRPAIIYRPETERVITRTPAAQALAAEADRFGACRPFLLVSRTLSEQTDEIDRIRAALAPRQITVFNRIGPHLPFSDLLSATDAARAAAPDLIVSIGGGSVIDGGKMLAIALKANLRSAD